MLNLFFRPAELQFYTSMASVVVQIPASVFFVDIQRAANTLTLTQVFAFILNGIFFHFQSITAYVLMDYISPVTHRYSTIYLEYNFNYNNNNLTCSFEFIVFKN